MEAQKKTVVVGMSGGVDSSVAAFLLKEQGYNVIGLFMKNWDEKDENGVCPSERDFEDVARVCEKLDIPYYAVDFVKEYWENVFQHFVAEYQMGYTPNPDILCNREIKFKVFFKKAMELGADYLATGHYARIGESNGKATLVKGLDNNKDQSYFLYTLKEDILAKTLFPIGHLEKKEVRALAEKAGLATFNKKDSTGICFIGEKNFRPFLAQFLAPKPGPIVTVDGKVIGEHQGIHFFTLGQRKGLGIGGGHGTSAEAWFVVEKRLADNALVVAQGEEHPALYSHTLTATELSLVSSADEEALVSRLPLKCSAKIRYRQKDVSCVIESYSEGVLNVSFPVPQRAITPRQSIVFYLGEQCLGGAMIKLPGISLYELKKGDQSLNNSHV